MQTDLITTAEALTILKRNSPATVSRMVKAGKLTPALKLTGKRGAYMFHRSDVEALRAEIEAAA